MRIHRKIKLTSKRLWAILLLAFKKFVRINGGQWGSSFAFDAFFSVFPLIVLLVAIASAFIDPAVAVKEIINYIEQYVPIRGDMQDLIFNTISGVVESRGQVGIFAFFILIWSALQAFFTLIRAANLAWNVKLDNWWKLPLKSLILLGITAGAVFLGLAAPVLMGMAEKLFFPVNGFGFWINALGSIFIPLVVLYIGLSLFYMLVLQKPVRFTRVWAAALFATILLQAVEILFVIYLKNFAMLNVVYGAFGGIMAMLIWIYLSGCIFILGACLCSVPRPKL